MKLTIIKRKTPPMVEKESRLLARTKASPINRAGLNVNPNDLSNSG